MIARFLLAWFLLVSAAAFWWPWPRLDPFLAVPGPWLSLLIVPTMFFIGAMLPRKEVDYVLDRWTAIFSGTAVQYLAMPFLGYSMGLIWQLGPLDVIGLVFVGCVPGAMASNVLTLNSNGNASYSVGLTTTATLLSPLVVPLALGLSLGVWDQRQFWMLLNSAVTLLWSVVLPVIAGFWLARRSPQWESWLCRFGPEIANAMILWIIGAVIALNRQRLASFDLKLLGALVSVNLLGYLAGYLGGRLLRLDEPMRRALTLEVGMQNAGLGATLALTLFSRSDETGVAVAPALYMFGCMLSGTVLAQIWSARDRAREQFA
jgi:BASS family bile acid:Na+ symporter